MNQKYTTLSRIAFPRQLCDNAWNPLPFCQPRAFHERELVISSRAHLPTWLPRTQRSRLVLAAMLESPMPRRMQRAPTTLFPLYLRIDLNVRRLYDPRKELTRETSAVENASRSRVYSPPISVHRRISARDV